MASDAVPASAAGFVIQGRFNHNGGKCWTVPLPQSLQPWADEPTLPRRSPFLLLEDGRPLATPHTPHARIAEEGAGLYSHWGRSIYFAASDGSDPNANGRCYQLVMAVDAPPGAVRALRDLEGAVPEPAATTAAGPELDVPSAARAVPLADTVLIAPGLTLSWQRLGLEVPAAAALRDWQAHVGWLEVPGTLPGCKPVLPALAQQGLVAERAGPAALCFGARCVKALFLGGETDELARVLRIAGFVSNLVVHSFADLHLGLPDPKRTEEVRVDLLLRKLFGTDQPLLLMCDMASALLAWILWSQGYQVRRVSLYRKADFSGHKLMEVWLPGWQRWLALDADFGMAILDSAGGPVGGEDLDAHWANGLVGIVPVQTSVKRWLSHQWFVTPDFRGQISWDRSRENFSDPITVESYRSMLRETCEFSTTDPYRCDADGWVRL